MSERTHKKSNWSSTTPQQDSALKLRRFTTKDDKDEQIQQSSDINLSKFSLPTNSPFPDSNIQRQEIEQEKEEGEETPGAQLQSDKTTSEEPEEEIQTKSEELNQEIDEPVQTKLTVGQPGDKYEQEADTVAAKVVEQINSPQAKQPVQGKVEPVVKPTVMRQGAAAGGAVNQDVEQNIQQARGSGQGLAENVRQPMEQAFGADFSGVKVHTDGQADVLNRSLNSRAFATGQDIFFKQGEYQPGSKQGQELLAHELTHVVQQKSSLSKIQQSGAEANAEDIPDSHILLEYVAHHFVYSDRKKYQNKNKKDNILTRAGYNTEDVEWKTGSYGFQACLIKPNTKNKRTMAPILAIRGTDNLEGLSTDFDFVQVGSNQFSYNHDTISKLLDRAERPVDLTGHSLGGAIAQIIAANFPGKVRNLVTFQSPGINLSTQRKFNRLQESKKPKHITHHIADKDVVDFAGVRRLPGTVYEHEQWQMHEMREHLKELKENYKKLLYRFWLRREGLKESKEEFEEEFLAVYKKLIAPHKAFLFATDKFQQRRERLGLSDEFMEKKIGRNIRRENSGITRYRRYPYQKRRFIAEFFRSAVSFVTSGITVPYDTDISNTQSLDEFNEKIIKKWHEWIKQYGEMIKDY